MNPPTPPLSQRYRVCVLGMGGVGIIAALGLTKSGICDVTAVVRSNYDLIKTHGYDIESVDHGKFKNWAPARLCHSVEEASREPDTPRVWMNAIIDINLPTGANTPNETPAVTYDYVVVCTKALNGVHKIIQPLVTPSYTTIVLLQNGWRIHIPYVRTYPNNSICSAVSTIGSHIEDVLSVKHIGPEQVKVGAHRNNGVDFDKTWLKTKEFVQVYKLGGANAIFAWDINYDRWENLLWNASYGPVCALLGMTVAQVQASGLVGTLIHPIMKEIQNLARRVDGVMLDEALMMRHILRVSSRKSFKPCMLFDKERGRPLEIEAILGNAIKRAKGAEKVPVPTLEMLYNQLKGYQWMVENRDRDLENAEELNGVPRVAGF